MVTQPPSIPMDSAGPIWSVVYLQNYVKNRKIFLCPSEPLAKWEDLWTTDFISYGLPHDIVGQYGTPFNNKPLPVKMEQLLRFSGKTPMLIGEAPRQAPREHPIPAVTMSTSPPSPSCKPIRQAWFPVNARHNKLGEFRDHRRTRRRPRHYGNSGGLQYSKKIFPSLSIRIRLQCHFR